NIQGQRVQELRKQYSSLVDAHGEESEAAMRAGSKLNNAIGTYDKLGQELETVSDQLKIQESRWYKAQQGLDKFSAKTGRIGSRLTDVGTTLTTRVTAPMMALGGTALASADKIDKAYRDIRVGT